MVTSVSTDGHYAITTNTNQQAILWDLQNHTYKIIAKHANIYSAYFIKNTNDFMYQNNTDNVVAVRNTDGQIIKTFSPGFATYGEVITSDLQNYFGADATLTLYKIDLNTNQKIVINQSWCVQDHNGAAYQGPATHDCIDFRGSNQLLQLQFTPNENHLIGANDGVFYIWSVENNTGKEFIKNSSQTTVAINPDGSYVVTADASGMGYYYNLTTQQGFNFFLTSPEDKTITAYLNPTLYAQKNNIMETLAIKFIDDRHLVAIFHGTPEFFNYATLYDLDHMTIDPKYWTKKIQTPIKYLPLIQNADTDFNYQKTWPLTDDQFSRDQAIDTSPTAHILVMAMDAANGIIVYQYDPSTQTLKQTWAPVVEQHWWEF